MDRLDKFSVWMSENTSLAQSSIGKYVRAVRIVSDEMLEQGVIARPLVYMDAIELSNAISRIINNDHFLYKDNKGNRMYSNGLNKFLEFNQSL